MSCFCLVLLTDIDKWRSPYCIADLSLLAWVATTQPKAKLWCVTLLSTPVPRLVIHRVLPAVIDRFLRRDATPGRHVISKCAVKRRVGAMPSMEAGGRSGGCKALMAMSFRNLEHPPAIVKESFSSAAPAIHSNAAALTDKNGNTLPPLAYTALNGRWTDQNWL